MCELSVFIPAIPPGVNHQYAHTRRGHFLTAPARQWLELAGLMTRAAMVVQGWYDHGGEFAVEIRHTARRQDVDGCVKIVLDGVTRALDVNDHRVRRLVVERGEGPDGVRVVIREWQRE